MHIFFNGQHIKVPLGVGANENANHTNQYRQAI